MGSLGEIVKINIGSLSESDAKNGGLNSLTYVSPPEWDYPSPQESLIVSSCEKDSFGGSESSL